MPNFVVICSLRTSVLKSGILPVKSENFTIICNDFETVRDGM